MFLSYIALVIIFVGLAVISKRLFVQEGMADITGLNRAPVDHERDVATTTDLTKDTVLSVYRNVMNKGEWEWQWMNNQRPEHYYRDPYFPKPQNSPMDLMAVPEKTTLTYSGFEAGDAPKTGFDGWTKLLGNTAIQPGQAAPEPIYMS